MIERYAGQLRNRREMQKYFRAYREPIQRARELGLKIRSSKHDPPCR